MKERKKAELLAPAGNYESFLGAVHAGADAVYLGGEKFGARAYADNFTTEQLCDAIHYAHLFGRKVYLTLNTLVKEKEMPQLYDYLFPFYEAGLDGVIIQDMGVFFYVKKHFPGLPLHVSTQMTITGTEGARMLKDLGAERIVPARELSLAEVGQIKKEVDIEIETFIHGAMCYCYSGQCLFSSILGGRSGNRGKCAQPCRLPYRIKGDKKEAAYYLSLKDMCTIDLIPELIEAGIDSFKIEGRMKKPEYAAGVTAIYRKYLDLYYEGRDAGEFLRQRPEAVKQQVEEEDRKKLASLYIRSELQDGYYGRHNAAAMITIQKPGYNESDEKLIKEIREKYIEKQPRIAVAGKVFLRPKEPAYFSVSGGGAQVTVKGAEVLHAINRPLTEEDVRKQMEKCGQTPFIMKGLSVEIAGDVFLPLKELNELRRRALERLEEEIKNKNGFAYEGRRALKETIPEITADDKAVKEETERTGKEGTEEEKKESGMQGTEKSGIKRTVKNTAEKGTVGKEAVWEAGARETLQKRFEDGIYISVQTKAQLNAVLRLLEDWERAGEQGDGRNPERKAGQETSQEAKQNTGQDPERNEVRDTRRKNSIQAVFVSTELFRCSREGQGGVILEKEERNRLEKLCGYVNGNVFAAYPYVMRNKDAWIHTCLMKEKLFSGVLVRNMEELALLGKDNYQGTIVTDAGLYVWNKEAAEFYKKKASLYTLPFELNTGEQKNVEGEGAMQVVYGRLPMMVTANCVRKTVGDCVLGKKGETKPLILTDRYGKEFPVAVNCRQCYNTIYNSVPLSLHRLVEKRKGKYRLDFTIEDEKETERVMAFFCHTYKKGGGEPPYKEYTTGHSKRGAD